MTTAMTRAAAVLTLAAISLAGCSSDANQQQQSRMGLTLLKQLMAARKAPAAPVILTRAQVRQIGVPVIRAALPARKVGSYMLPSDSKGPVETWATLDGLSISLRNGVLIQTRGLGNDLMSAAVPDAARIARGAGEVAATYYFLNGLDQSVAVPVTCSLQDKGRENIVVTQIRYAVRHITQSCAGANVQFTNDYWFDSRHKIRQSRQWVSPLVGYMEIDDLRE